MAANFWGQETEEEDMRRPSGSSSQMEVSGGQVAQGAPPQLRNITPPATGGAWVPLATGRPSTSQPSAKLTPADDEKGHRTRAIGVSAGAMHVSRGQGSRHTPQAYLTGPEIKQKRKEQFEKAKAEADAQAEKRKQLLEALKEADRNLREARDIDKAKEESLRFDTTLGPHDQV